jgi:small subunit ribosomal protein S20
VANHASSRKRVRQTERRTQRNRHVRTTVRTYMKRVRAALGKGDTTDLQSALALAVKTIDRAVSKGVFHRKTGSRYVSRLMARAAALTKQA